MKIIAVILAGGFGTRIKHLLPNIPKPMVEVLGNPFIEWIITYLKSQGIDEFIISTGYLGEIIEKYFTDKLIEKIQVKCYRETVPLGTGGGFINAVKESQESPTAWLITNGDSLIFADIKPMFTCLKNDTVSGVILGLSVSDAERYGTLEFDNENNLINFVEKKPGAGIINAGIYLLRHSLIEEFNPQTPLSFEKEIFPHLLKQNVKIKVHIVKAPFLDIGTPTSLAEAENFIKQNFTTDCSKSLF